MPPRYQIAVTALSPTASDGPHTRGHIYHKKITDSTIGYVNVELNQREVII
jgi:hypothetical protein